MTVLAILMAVYVAAGLAYWGWQAYAVIRLRRGVPRLESFAVPERERWPPVSVVVAARNEAEKIEPAARSLLALDYPDLEIVLVDDRSSDATGAILDRLAASDPRVRAIHIRELPDGWLGKTHALEAGYRESAGDWVLFTDADVHFHPGVLRRAIALAESRGLDFLAVLPRLWATHLVLDSLIAGFIRQFLLLMTRPWSLSRPLSRAFIGVGAFNLVRRSAFEQTAGFEWLRMEVADDAGLGLMMRQSGFPCGAAAAFDQVGLHWYRTVGDALRGAEKGWASVCRFSLCRAAVVASVVLALEMAPVVALWLLALAPVRWIGCAGAIVLAAFVFTVVMLGRWAGGRVVPGLLSPLTAVLSAYGLIRAAVLGKRRGGVLWRETFYPDGVLRAGQRVRLP